jgi:hypothetical protein
MNLFWENISRYPKFLITSISGLIIIILSPGINFIKKNKKNQIVLIIFVTLVLIFFKIILERMLNL